MSCILRKRFFLSLHFRCLFFYLIVLSLFQSTSVFILLGLFAFGMAAFFGILFSFPFRSGVFVQFSDLLYSCYYHCSMYHSIHVCMCKIHVVQPTVCGCRTFISVESIYLSMMSTEFGLIQLIFIPHTPSHNALNFTVPIGVVCEPNHWMCNRVFFSLFERIFYAPRKRFSFSFLLLFCCGLRHSHAYRENRMVSHCL